MKRSLFVSGLILTLAAAAPAWAQNVPQAPAARGPAMQRPAPTPAQASGNLARFLVGPGGRVRGLVLDNGAVVMVPPRASSDLAQRVRVGQPLRVEGFTFPGAASGSTTIFRATVRGADGSVIAAPPAQGQWAQRGAAGAPGGPMGQGGWGHGGFGHGGRHGGGFGHGGFGEHDGARAAHLAAMPAQAVNGAVQQVLSGPRGGVRAILFANGVTVYPPRPMMQQLQQRGVRVGERVRASGRGTVTPQGTGIVAEHITFADGTTLDAPIPTQPAAPPAAPAR